MTEEVPAHIQRHRVSRASAALPEWAAVKFTDAQAAAMRPVGIEMLNKRGVCALHLKVIADAAGVSVGTARDALNIADTIGLITIQRHRVGRASAALPEWAAVKFTDAQAAAMRPVGIEMLNKRGVCALHLKIIADAAGVGIGAAREALNIADTIGLITIERQLRGLYNMRSRSPEWLAGLRELQERTEHFERETVVKKAARR